MDGKTKENSPGNTGMTILQSLYQTLNSFRVQILNHSFLFPTTPHKPRTKASIHSLPNELLLEIFSFLELKPYILCHGVSKTWRQLLPSTNLHPTRKRLLALYRRILRTEGFQKAFVWTEKNVQPFDREEYISCLLRQYPVIPEEYRMWILEWPARLIIRCTWPGLPFVCCLVDSEIVRRLGVNWIAYRSFSPQLSSVVYKYATPSHTFVPALFIWRRAQYVHWLVFEQDDPDLFGRVFITDGLYHNAGTIPYYPPRTDNDDSDEDTDSDSEPSARDCLIIFEDWIKYLESLWYDTVKEIQRARKAPFSREEAIPQPVGYLFRARVDNVLPAPPWDSRQHALPR